LAQRRAEDEKTMADRKRKSGVTAGFALRNMHLTAKSAEDSFDGPTDRSVLPKTSGLAVFYQRQNQFQALINEEDLWPQFFTSMTPIPQR
jgi:hypothetical protein